MKAPDITPKGMAKKLVTDFDINNAVYSFIKDTVKLTIIKANIFKAIDLILETHPISTARDEYEIEFIQFWAKTKEEVETLIINSMPYIVSK